MKLFYNKIAKVKHIKRQGWIDRGLDADTIGSHIFGASNIGWYLSYLEKVNSSKVIGMLIIHDLVMAEMQDITPESGKYLDKKDQEKIAKIKVANCLPKTLSNQYLLLFDEFQDQKTVESQIARESDKLETLLQGEYYEENVKKDILSEFLDTYKDIFKSNNGKKIYNEIKIRHVKRKLEIFTS